MIEELWNIIVGLGAFLAILSGLTKLSRYGAPPTESALNRPSQSPVNRQVEEKQNPQEC